ncbi:MAG: polyprenyl synthetase family protein [Gammaproteobacteria bacterium]
MKKHEPSTALGFANAGAARECSQAHPPSCSSTHSTNQPRSRLIRALGFETEIERLEREINTWIEQASEEMRAALEWQFQGGSKYFRPLTIFSCHRALSDELVSDGIIRSAMVLEMFHNVSLIIDDILDRSRYRRRKLTLHCRFGNLVALMTSGYIVADGFASVVDDPFDIRLLSELLKRLGVAECMQWRLRQKPLGVEDWRMLAGEDTGSMFEVCACLGARHEGLRKFGYLLGMLYHGCDDIADVRGAEALGGGGTEDLRDGILTLPAAIAIREQEVASLFADPKPANMDALAAAFKAALPEAERYLDTIAEEAKAEARAFSRNPQPLEALVDETRQLSNV